MNRRLELQDKFEELLGSRQVYYQPPESVKLSYPCIIYKRSSIMNNNANNQVYRQDTAYEVTVIDKRPDSEIVYKLSRFPKTYHNRHYTYDNLNHDIFTIYY